MAKMTCALVKRSLTSRKAPMPAKAGAPGAPKLKAPDSFILVDNEDSTVTVNGVDLAGQEVDISGVAALTVTSSDPTVASSDAPTGMTFKLSGFKPGTCTISVTATWTDGSVGPFTFDLPLTVTGSAVTGIVIDIGPPVVRP